MRHDFTYTKFKTREYLSIMMEIIIVVTVGAAVVTLGAAQILYVDLGIGYNL